MTYDLSQIQILLQTRLIQNHLLQKVSAKNGSVRRRKRGKPVRNVERKRKKRRRRRNEGGILHRQNQSLKKMVRPERRAVIARKNAVHQKKTTGTIQRWMKKTERAEATKEMTNETKVMTEAAGVSGVAARVPANRRMREKKGALLQKGLDGMEKAVALRAVEASATGVPRRAIDRTNSHFCCTKGTYHRHR